tara:strand:- start:163 stop:930 length:768 start_codon:yes stop_codon:yes gene_type:complete
MPHIPGHRLPMGAEVERSYEEFPETRSVNNEINPYEYYSEFESNPYTTESAYGDIGVTPSQRFLGETDPLTGLSYRDLIPQYDSFAEDRLRSQFQEGIRGMYSSSVGELAGIRSQASMQSAQSGFAGGGAIQSALSDASGALRRNYGDAFSGSLLDLTSGIRAQRMGYQEDLANLLAGFQERTPDYDIYDRSVDVGVQDDGSFAPSYEPGESLSFEGETFNFPLDNSGGDRINLPSGASYVWNSSTQNWQLDTGG